MVLYREEVKINRDAVIMQKTSHVRIEEPLGFYGLPSITSVKREPFLFLKILLYLLRYIVRDVIRIFDYIDRKSVV